MMQIMYFIAGLTGYKPPMSSENNYLLIVDLKVGHADCVVPVVSLFLLCSHKIENLPHCSWNNPWLLRSAQHSVSLTWDKAVEADKL